MLLKDQNVQAEFRRLFLYKPINSRTLIKIMQGTHDMNKCLGKYICLDQSRNKDISRIMLKRILNVHLRLWTLKY